MNNFRFFFSIYIQHARIQVQHQGKDVVFVMQSSTIRSHSIPRRKHSKKGQ